MTLKKTTLESLSVTKALNKKRPLAMREKYESKRDNIWEAVPSRIENDEYRVLWEQTADNKKGFVNIPRAMPIIMKIMDLLAPKGKPVSSAYLALWCRDFGTGFIEIKDIDNLALEASFTGPRATTTLNTRIKILSNEDDNGLGFIRTKKGVNGKYQSILMLNPLLVIYLKYRDNTKTEGFYNLLFDRSLDVQDLDLIKMRDLSEKELSHVTNILDELKST